MLERLGDFRIQSAAMRYSIFVPRLFNLCLELGFQAGYIMPSRAFCSDESQGYPIILISKHFGTFPFNHGQVGGVVATDRHGPHAHHGHDLVLIQASHVGYDPATEHFGSYRRLQTHDHELTSSCGKICGVLHWYESEYQFAQENILLRRQGDEYRLIIDNQLLDQERGNGLFLRLDKLVEYNADNQPLALKSYSTAHAFRPTRALIDSLPNTAWNDDRGQPIGEHLLADYFYYNRQIQQQVEGRSHLESNLLAMMPQIITSPNPALAAAKVNTQVEFDRTFRTIAKSSDYQGKRLLFISGINVDISPQEGQIFPLTKFVPWAAYFQDGKGTHYTLEQGELVEKLLQQSTDNPSQIDLEDAIQLMQGEQEILLPANI
jgi:hypothetical protein